MNKLKSLKRFCTDRGKGSLNSATIGNDFEFDCHLLWRGQRFSWQLKLFISVSGNSTSQASPLLVQGFRRW